jgi:hypothetical protein
MTNVTATAGIASYYNRQEGTNSIHATYRDLFFRLLLLLLSLLDTEIKSMELI